MNNKINNNEWDKNEFNHETMERQEKYNETLLKMMCLTFNKKQMKQLVEVYIKTNSLTADIIALKKELEHKKEDRRDMKNKIDKLREDFEMTKEIFNEIEDIKNK